MSLLQCTSGVAGLSLIGLPMANYLHQCFSRDGPYHVDVGAQGLLVCLDSGIAVVQHMPFCAKGGGKDNSSTVY